MTKLPREKAIKISVITALLLAISKIAIALITGSLAILASGIDSIFDTLSSAGNLWAAKKSKAEPTENFQYGFGKIEGIFGLIQGVLISLSGLAIATAGMIKILKGGDLVKLDLATATMLLSVLTTIALVIFLKKNNDNSLLMKAEISHFSSDILANLAVLIGIIIIYFTEKFWLDGSISIIISILILKSGIDILKTSIFQLLDREADEKINQYIKNILEKNVTDKKLTSFHFLRTREAGNKIFVDAHLVFTEKTLLRKAHDIADNIESTITKKIKNAEILFHLDPKDDSQKSS